MLVLQEITIELVAKIKVAVDFLSEDKKLIQFIFFIHSLNTTMHAKT